MSNKKKEAPVADGAEESMPAQNEPASALLQALDADAETAGCLNLPEQSAPFPLGVFPVPWQRLATQYAELACMPVQLPAMLMLAAASAACGKSVAAVDGSNHQDGCRPNLFIMACAKSSTGKDVSAKLIKPLSLYEKEMQKRFRENDLPSIQLQLDKAKQTITNKKASDTDKHEAYRIQNTLTASIPNLTVGNATSEALAGQLKRNDETLFCFSCEAGDMLRTIAGQYKKSGGDYSLYNAAYSGTYTEHLRVTREAVTLSAPCLSLFWAVQPNYFSEILNSQEAIESGFIPRLLAFDAEADYADDDGQIRAVDTALFCAWGELIRKILDHRFSNAFEEIIPSNLQCSEEAREIFRNFHNRTQAQRRKDEYTAPLLGKARENAIRTALVLSVMGSQPEITKETAQGACSLVEWCQQSIIRLMKAGRGSALAQDAQRLEADLQNGEETLRNLTRGHWTDARILQIAEQFPDRFEVAKKETGGRPSMVVRLKSEA